MVKRLVSLSVVIASLSAPAAEALTAAARMLESEMKRNPVPCGIDKRKKPKWEYTDGLELQAALAVAKRCPELREKTLAWAQDYIERMVTKDGEILGYRMEDCKLDCINPGKFAFDMYDLAGGERLRKVLDTQFAQFAIQPRVAEGGFWHKKVYTHQMWLDGLYMGCPFYARYASRFLEGDAKRAAFDDIANQFAVVTRHTYDAKTGLYRHGWDESKSMIWADKATGQSAHAWGRALGWFAAAIVDTEEYFPPDHPGREQLRKLLREYTATLIRWQDSSGAWWQVADQPGREGNYLESTATALIGYAMMKGVNRGILGEDAKAAALKAWNALNRDFLKENPDGTVSLTRCCSVAGLSADRDGSFEYYLREKIVDNDPKGVGPYMLLAIETCPQVAASACRASGGVGDYKKTVQRRVAPVTVETRIPGRTLVDFGREAFGFLELVPPAGARGPYEVRLGELVKSDGSVNMNPGATIRAARVTGSVDADGVVRVPLAADKRNTSGGREGGAIQIPPEHGVIMPFRYVEVMNAPFEVTKETVRMVAVNYPIDLSESCFACSDERLNRVYELCRHTILVSSFAGLYVDGDRERIPYEADAYINQLSDYAVHSDYSLGRASHVYLMKHPTWPTEWKQHSIFMAWADWMWSGDTGALAEFYEQLRGDKLLERFRRDSDGLLATGGERLPGRLANEKGAADIVDWPPCERDGFVFRDVNAVVNAFYYRNLLQVAEFARALGKPDDADVYERRARDVRRAYNEAFFDAGRGVCRDGIGTEHASLHANAAALACGLLSGQDAKRVASYCISRGMACSVYFAQYLLEGLFNAGEADAAIALMTSDGDRSWLGMMEQGATTTMEAWAVKYKPNLDLCHAWGTAPLNIVSRYLLGVTPLEPGFAKILVRPQIGSLARVEGRVPTAKGPVEVRIEDGVLTLDLPAPARVEWAGAVSDVLAGHHVFRSRASGSAFDIQREVDCVAAAGGGRVVVPAGEWTSGAIHLKSNVELYLSEGAKIVFTENLDDYLPAVRTSWEGIECMGYSPLVYAYGCTNVAITGKGTLAPSVETRWRAWGLARKKNPAHDAAKKRLAEWARDNAPMAERQYWKLDGSLMRPPLIQFNRCKGVRLEGVTIRQSPFWTIHLLCSEDVVVRGLDVYCDLKNSDGIDIESSRNVLVENCTFEQGDDAVVIKSGINHEGRRRAMPSEDIVVRNCVINDGHSMLSIGSELSGGIRNVLMEDCRAEKTVDKIFFIKTNPERGGFVENVTMRRIKALDVKYEAVSAITDYFWKPDSVPLDGVLRATPVKNIVLEDISATSAKAVYSFRGYKTEPIRGLRLKNIKIGKAKNPSSAELVEDMSVVDTPSFR